MNSNKRPILVVDDDPDDRMIISEIFEKHLPKQPCYVFSDGIDFFNWIDYHYTILPCLITLDINMPGMTGFDILKQLRNRYSKERLSVIFLTTSSHERDFLIAKELGANAIYTKPSSYSQTVQLIASLVFHYCGSNFQENI